MSLQLRVRRHHITIRLHQRHAVPLWEGKPKSKTQRIQKCLRAPHCQMQEAKVLKISALGFDSLKAASVMRHTTIRELQVDGRVPVYALQIAFFTRFAQLVRSAEGFGGPIVPMYLPSTYIQVGCSILAASVLAADSRAITSPSLPV